MPAVQMPAEKAWEKNHDRFTVLGFVFNLIHCEPVFEQDPNSRYSPKKNVRIETKKLAGPTRRE